MCGVLLALPAATAAGGEPAPGVSASNVLAAVEQSMAKVKSVRTAFRQEKKLAILSAPLTNAGTLYLENPGKLAWHGAEPVRYAFVMEGDRIRQWDEDTDKVQTLSLSGNPVVRVVGEQLKGWFAGRFHAMAADYDVSVVRADAPIVLRFVPRPSAFAARMIRSVTMTFREDARYVKELVIEEAGGDSTRMEFFDTVLDEPIPAQAWEVKPRD